MTKLKKFNPIKETSEKENIEIIELMSDRILCRLIVIEPKEKSGILDPNTGLPVKKEDGFDRHQGRAEIVAVGEKIKKEFPNIVPGMRVFLESKTAAYTFPINGEELLQTRLSNIILIYKEK